MQSASYINKAQGSGNDHRHSPVTIQPELKVGNPDSKYEKQADEVADEVMMKPDSVNDEMVQMQPANEVEDIFRKSNGVEEELQMQPIKEAPESEIQMEAMEVEEMIQQDSINENPTKGFNPASPELTSKINASRGSGKTLDTSVQNEMGQKMNHDFSDVNIHTGDDAVGMSNEIGAKAFTVGNDIYFNQGQYDPNSSDGKHLLAHELTHTVQQGESAKRKMIQKEESDEETYPEMTPSTGVIDEDEKTITFESVSLPGFKLDAHRGELYNLEKPLKRKNKYTRGNPNQREGVWKPEIQKDKIQQRLSELYIDHHHQPPASDTTHVFVANVSGRSPKPMYIGNISDIVVDLTTPTWGNDKEYRSFDVDHIVELQLSNWNTESWPNTLRNMELLDSSTNRSSGSVIQSAITDKLNQFRERHNEQYPGSDGYFKDNYTLVFENGEPGGGENASLDENKFWKQSEIEDGDHLDAIELGSLADIGGEGEVRIFPKASGGLGKRFYWTEDNTPDSSEVNWFGKPFKIVHKSFHTSGDSVENTAELGTLEINIPETDKTWYPWDENKPISVKRYPGSKYAGYIEKYSLLSQFRNMRVKKASPIEIYELDLEENGLKVFGVIMPTFPIFEDSPIEFSLIDGDFRVYKSFSLNDLNVPSPFEISEADLTIFASSEDGLGLSGQVNFGINNVGEGFVGASASTSGGFELEGNFNFDSDLFDPASISVEYKDEIWTIGGEIGIPEGKVRGVKSATITATYSEGNFEATGDAELDIPGIERGTMNIQYNDEGFSIGGAFDLSSDIPGIRSGRVEATVSKQSGDEEYNVLVRGTAQPDILGVNSSLSVEYDNGALTITGSASYSRGMLSGSVSVGATNRTINEDGQPEGEPDDTMRVYGGGSLTLRLTPWLEATAGVKFLPNGEMEVQGRIGLPGVVDVFPRNQIRRNLFTVPTIEIPLFAIPLGPRSIGLVAQIGGGLDFEAGFGPGQLRELFAEITYNPDREEETTLHGRGVFAIPADAGLTLRGNLGLGVSVAIASLTGGIELAGTLGLEGEAAASVDVNWSPQTGIELDAEGRVTVNPKFEFNVNAFARGTLGIGWLSVSKTWRHRLAGFEWGPDIQFGLVFPINYKEGEPFDLSFSDIEVIYPELNIPQMARGLASDIKNDIF